MTMIRQLRAILVPLLFLSLCSLGFAQNAQIQGEVSDSSGAVIPKASVRVVNQQAGTERKVLTNGNGIYSVSALDPSVYKIFVQAPGFSTAVSTAITLNVGQNAVLDFKMKIGDERQTVSVDASGLDINKTDASVSTVVDRKFVESMPLNGRSFQSLILLAPGVVTNNPQSSAFTGGAGEFSINGQRTDANYYSIDGVSANNGVFSGSTTAASSAGGLPAASALGSTQALISVDALQEFRVNTSTYSAEYGRQPGGQIQFETRSGTNQFHGTAFDYLRNTVFDANSWFNDYHTPPLPKPAEHQNDFGGVLGGPLMIPKLYSGHDRALFFFSYEGLRLDQPEPASVSYVPTNDPTSAYPYGNLRHSAPAALRPLLNAFPLPNCTAAQDPQCIDDSVEGLAPYVVSTSLPSSIDAVSVRGDYLVAPWLRMFFRYSDTESSAVSSIHTYKSSLAYSTRSYTLGADGTLRAKASNQFRFNYSPTSSLSVAQPTAVGGGTPVDMQALQGLPTGRGETALSMTFTNESSYLYQEHFGIPQHQWNIVDTVSWLSGRHNLRLGIDYRRTTSYLNAESFTRNPDVQYSYASPGTVLSNNTDGALVQSAARQDPAFTNFSAFAQDEWQMRPNLSLSLGLRWELNPPPFTVSGIPHATINGNFKDPASLSIAPAGTPQYHTTYYDFAPRLGVAATLHQQPGQETVFRAGAGVYYDTGQQLATLFGGGYGPGEGILQYYGTDYGTPVSFPMPLSLINVPYSQSLIPPYQRIYTVSHSLQLPYTYQWNASLEQALGSEQSVIIGYVGSNGRRLLEDQYYNMTGVNPLFVTVIRYFNGLSSSYNALQVQYKRRLNHGLQALASYTWSHGLDFSSGDSGLLPYQRGNSDFDVRNNFTAALSYDVPNNYADTWKRTLVSHWGTDLRFTARTAFPIQVRGAELRDPVTGSEYYGLLNYRSDVPLYLKQPKVPGGRVVNRAAFSVPVTGQVGDAPRNFIRGFGENEVNVAIRRDFPLYEQLHLLFRAEAFNLLNHPNFGAINVTCGNPSPGSTCTNLTFGQATSTLASSLGGLTPIYQQGGPRSLQFALKLQF